MESMAQKFCRLFQSLREMAFTIYWPLSVVMLVSLSSFRLQHARASFNLCAWASSVWSSGKKAVCKHRLLTVKSGVIKWIVKVQIWLSLVRLDHKSDVVEQILISRNSASTTAKVLESKVLPYRRMWNFFGHEFSLGGSSYYHLGLRCHPFNSPYRNISSTLTLTQALQTINCRQASSST